MLAQAGSERPVALFFPQKHFCRALKVPSALRDTEEESLDLSRFCKILPGDPPFFPKALSASSAAYRLPRAGDKRPGI